MSSVMAPRHCTVQPAKGSPLSAVPAFELPRFRVGRIDMAPLRVRLACR